MNRSETRRTIYDLTHDEARSALSRVWSRERALADAFDSALYARPFERAAMDRVSGRWERCMSLLRRLEDREYMTRTRQ